MRDRTNELIELGVALLEHIRWANDAYARAKQDPENDNLCRIAHMLSEQKENITRAFSDAIVDVRLDLNDRVRAVCLPGYSPSNGRVINTKEQP